MRIDCRDMSCPEPIILTKRALEELENGEILDILVNSEIVKNNILCFLDSNSLSYEITDNRNECVITTRKQGDLVVLSSSQKKVIYLNSDGVGEGDVRQTLLASLLVSFAEFAEDIEAVICVNAAVKITTDRSHKAFRALRDFESLGVRVLNCGSCLKAYSLIDRLAIGEISNSFEIAQILMKCNEIKL